MQHEHTLFFPEETSRMIFKSQYRMDVSEQFMSCANIQLSKYFILHTGLKPGKEVSSVAVMGMGFAYPNLDFYIKGESSKIPMNIYINHNWNQVTLLWKSKSGRIYDVSDTDIDCNDIEFWFEGLDAALYHQQLYPREELPFKLKGLTYELKINRLNMACEIEMYTLQTISIDSEATVKHIDNFINQFNEHSMLKDRKYGVVHNWKATIEKDKIVYDH